MDSVIKAWGLLVALSAVTTAFATFGGNLGGSLAVVIVILSGWKARIILNDYLMLKLSPFWRRGFNAFIAMFLFLALGLYFLPVVT